MEISKEGVTETQVFVGAVKIATSGTGTEHTVRAGQVMRVDGKKVLLAATSHSDTDSKRFVRTMPTLNRPQMAVADAYAELILSMQPAVYYRMEQPKDEKDRNILFDSAPGGHHGVIHFSEDYVGQPYASGRFGQALRFRGPIVGDYAIVSDYPKALDDRLTVAAWTISNAREGCPMIAANWGSNLLPGRLCTGQFHFGLFGDTLAVNVTQRNETSGALCESEVSYFPPGQWQHVAFTADGTTLRLYRNGIEVASEPRNGILPRPPMASLGIGCRTTNDGVDLARESPCYWWGLIDELAVFNRALSPEQILKLYRGPTSAPIDVVSDSAEAAVQPSPQQQNAE